MQIHLDTQNPAAYINEFANISLQMASIRKTPTARVKDAQLINTLMIVFCGTGMLNALVLIFVTKSYFLAFLMGCLGGLSLPYIKTAINLSKYKKNAKFDGNYDLDKYGITHIKDGIMVKIFWKKIKTIRVYKTLFLFIPEDPEISIMVVPIEYKTPMFEYLRQNGINIPVIDPAAG